MNELYWLIGLVVIWLLLQLVIQVETRRFDLNARRVRCRVAASQKRR